MSGKDPAQNSRRNVNRWICVSLLDAGDKTLPRAINDTSRASKRQ